MARIVERHPPPPCCSSYGHSYSGYMSAVSTYLSAAREEAGANVSYISGSGISIAAPGGPGPAAAIAATADVVILCVGLGTIFEGEGNDRSSLSLPAPQVRCDEGAPDRRLVCIELRVEGFWACHAKSTLLHCRQTLQTQ